MSQSSGNPSGYQSESHDPDSGQVRKNSPEIRKDSLVTTSKDELSLAKSKRLDSWFDKLDGHDDAALAKGTTQDGSDLLEDWKSTSLHELLQGTKDDYHCSRELEKRMSEWEDIVNVQSPEHQNTALHMAVRKGFNKTTRQLLTAGAKVNIENESGESPLHLACEYGDQELVEMLLETGADPERMDASGIYPLHTAVVRGFESTVVYALLGPRGIIINQPVGTAHWTPLNKALYYNCEDMVDVLLEGGASLRVRDSDGWTPLMTAIKASLYKTFHKLLEHLREHPTEWDIIDIPDNDGMTPLMQLSASDPGESKTYAVKDLLQMYPDVNITDNEGKTALHHATASVYRTEAEPCIDVASKLVDSLFIERLMQLDKYGETAFDVAFDKHEKSPIPAFKSLLDSLVHRLVEGESIEEPLCWAAYHLERHTLALGLFQKNFDPKKIPQGLKHDQWTIVEWAVYARMPRVLLTYLQELGPEQRTSGDYRLENSISNGRTLIETFKKEMQSSSARLAEGQRQKREHGLKSGTEPGKDAQLLRNMEDILGGILDYVYPEKGERPAKPLEVSKPAQNMESSLNSFRATIIQSSFVKFRTIRQLLYDGESLKHIHDNATWLKEFEYEPKVSSAQTQTSQTFGKFQANTRASPQFTWIHLPSTNMTWMEDTARKILKEEGCGKNEAEKVASFLRSSWIEIPDRTSASRFMRPRYVFRETENATKQHTEDRNELKDASGRRSGQRGTHSWYDETREGSDSDRDEVDSGKSFESEFASQTEAELTGGRSTDVHVGRAWQTVAEKDKSFAVSAIYMPYLYFSTYHQDESGEKVEDRDNPSTAPHERRVQDEISRRQKLFKAYEDSVIHQPTTLDEFYYQFALDEDSVRDRNLRNKDQVVTKYLCPGGIEKRRYWPLLRVSQLWVWTIDEKWLITSTSCATNNIQDNLVTDILGHLRKQVQNGSRRFGPNSAAEMSRVIVDYCIGTYERKRKSQSQVNADRSDQSSTEDEKLNGERSIRQIFSDSINEIGRNESSLFSISHRRRHHAGEPETSLEADHTSEIEGLQDALEEVANQLCHIKDIRDELNILKSIATFQYKVQSTMAGRGADEDLSSDYLLKNIEELNKLAEQTQEAVKTTLTLQESDIANWQASESMKQGVEAFKQGKIVLVFTLVTVWFLPLSFLTSLFALDVGTFMKTPAWAFYVIFLVPLIFLGLAAVYVWKTEIGVFLGLVPQAKGQREEVKRSDEEAKEGTSTSRFNLVKRALRKRKGIDVEHG